MKPWLVGFSTSISVSLLPALALAQSATPPPTAVFPPAAAPAPTPGAATVPAAPPAAPAEPVAPPAEPPPAAPPAAAVAPPAAATAPSVVAPLSEPPPPPERSTDARPIRQQRPFYVGGELGWNGLAGLGVNFSYHPIPYLALDAGLGLSVAGWRVGGRVRANFLTSEWTPFLGAGLTYSAGSGGQEIEIESKSDKAKLEVLASPYLQLAGGVNYTGSEGFVFQATTGYAILLRDHNTEFVSGSTEAYDDVKTLFEGGVILSVAFGYAF